MGAASRYRRGATPGRGAAAAGFTLVEVLAVMAIISIMAAVATPGLVNMMRERRTSRETGMFADVFRVARSKAMGRGAAVRVEIVGGDTPYMVIAEHVSGTMAGNVVSADSLPVPGCNALGQWRTVESFSGRAGATTLRLFAPGEDTSAPSGHTPAAGSAFVCYTPRGRTYTDIVGGGAFVELQGVVTLTTERGTDGGSDTNATDFRRILVLPNGLTRMEL